MQDTLPLLTFALPCMVMRLTIRYLAGSFVSSYGAVFINPDDL